MVLLQQDKKKLHCKPVSAYFFHRKKSHCRAQSCIPQHQLGRRQNWAEEGMHGGQGLGRQQRLLPNLTPPFCIAEPNLRLFSFAGAAPSRHTRTTVAWHRVREQILYSFAPRRPAVASLAPQDIAVANLVVLLLGALGMLKIGLPLSDKCLQKCCLSQSNPQSLRGMVDTAAI